ncbi:DUF2274 domain-containing protein [Mesorhizobium sp. M0601]|uniref:hypothetical protein n=1 Tax=Mesorhizobium sp. M0601 TaxID=2956969 RepID=UPI00333D61D7
MTKPKLSAIPDDRPVKTSNRRPPFVAIWPAYAELLGRGAARSWVGLWRWL